MKPVRTTHSIRSSRVPREARIVIAASIAFSVMAVVAYAATLPV